MKVYASTGTAVAYVVIGLGCFYGGYTLLPKGVAGCVIMVLAGLPIIAIGVALLRLRHLPILLVENGQLTYRSAFSREYESVPIERIRSVAVKKYSSGRGYSEVLDVRGDFTPFTIGMTQCAANSKEVAAEIERLAAQVRKW